MNLADLEKLFTQLNVDYTYPGFYNEPSFVLQEQKDSHFLENYADYVMLQEYTPEYLENAQKIITSLTSFVYSELKKDGRLGACVDTNGFLMKILEKENIWSCVMQGILTIYQKVEDKIIFKYNLSPFNLNRRYGHTWLFAPPFNIVDITLRLQEYTDVNFKTLIPDECILSNNVKLIDNIPIQDIIDYDFLQHLKRQRLRILTLDDLSLISPHSIKKYGSYIYEVNDLLFVYTIAGISAPDTSLEDFQSITLSGKLPIEIYQEYLANHKPT
jgi:hypothetical protein